MLEFPVTVYKTPLSLRKFCGGLRPKSPVYKCYWAPTTSPSLVRFLPVPCRMTCPHRVFFVNEDQILILLNQLLGWEVLHAHREKFFLLERPNLHPEVLQGFHWNECASLKVAVSFTDTSEGRKRCRMNREMPSTVSMERNLERRQCVCNVIQRFCHV